MDRKMAVDAATMPASDETTSKRVRNASPKPDQSKRRKVSDDSAVVVKDTPKAKKGSKPDIELASAMALASLAALSPNSKYDQPEADAKGIKDAPKAPEDESRDKAQERGEDDGIRVAASASWETRSPKADIPAESPVQRTESLANRKVHFHPATKGDKDKETDEVMEESPARSDRTESEVHESPEATQETPPQLAAVTPQTPYFRPSMRRGAFVPAARSPHRRYAVGAMTTQSRTLTPPHLTHVHGSRAPPPMPPPYPPMAHPHAHTPVRMANVHHSHPPAHHPHRQHHSLPPRPHPHPHTHHMHPSSQPWSQRTRFMAPPPRIMQPTLKHSASQWICDYCNVAAFHTYEAACVHEEICKLYFKSSSERDSVREGHAANRLYRPLMGQQQKLLMEIKSSMSHESMDSSRTSASASTASSSIIPAAQRRPRMKCFTGAMSLALDGPDQDWLSELNCFVRKECIEAFTANEEDVSRTSKRGRITLHQVGIRCRFCRVVPADERGVAAVSFPTTLGGIYESVKRWQKVHLNVCDMVPPPMRERLDALANNNEWVPTTRQYWADAARALGLMDTPDGIRFSKDPDDVAREEAMSKMGSKATGLAPNLIGNYPIEREGSDAIISTAPSKESAALEVESIARSASSANDNDPSEYIVFPVDIDSIPPYVYFLMRQVEPCRFTEADRFVARSKGPVGYAGFQCRHCNGHAGLGKYFPVSSKSLSTNSTSQNIHAHLLKCRKCPEHIKDRLVQLKIEKGRAPRMEPGWRRVFFDKVWNRLHG